MLKPIIEGLRSNRCFSINPELISIHIPKTAGSSFLEILRQQYGWQLKHIYKREELRDFRKPEPFLTHKPFVKAVHGHIPLALPAWRELYPNAKWITWLRHPVDRVVSAYYHWQRPIDHRDPNHQVFIEKQPTLLAFAEMDAFKRGVQIYQTILNQTQPEDFFFVGQMELFNEDVQRLGKLLHWKKNIKLIKTNVNPAKKTISPAERQALEELLRDEIKLWRAWTDTHCVK